MAKNFSLKVYEAQLEKDAIEGKEFWKSKKGKQILKNHRSTPELDKRLLEIEKVMKGFEDRVGQNISEYFKEFRDKSALECEKIFQSMNEVQGFIKPYKSDELAGFFIWLVDQKDFYTELPDRSIYYEFDKYQRTKIKDGPIKCLDDEETNDLKSLECKLTEQQIIKIFDLVKEIKLFEDPFDLMDLKGLFYCSTNKPLKVKNNQNLAWLFNYLQPEFITTKWQSIIDNNKCLIGNKGAFLTAKNLSASLSSVSKLSEVSKKITTVITKLNTPN